MAWNPQIAVFQVRTHHLDDRLYFWIKTHWHTDDWQERSVWLPDYRVELDAKPVPGVDNNLSGLTFDPDRNLLWAVTNGPNELLALSRDGDLRRRTAWMASMMWRRCPMPATAN